MIRRERPATVRDRRAWEMAADLLQSPGVGHNDRVMAQRVIEETEAGSFTPIKRMARLQAALLNLPRDA